MPTAPPEPAETAVRPTTTGLPPAFAVSFEGTPTWALLTRPARHRHADRAASERRLAEEGERGRRKDLILAHGRACPARRDNPVMNDGLRVEIGELGGDLDSLTPGAGVSGHR